MDDVDIAGAASALRDEIGRVIGDVVPGRAGVDAVSSALQAPIVVTLMATHLHAQLQLLDALIELSKPTGHIRTHELVTARNELLRRNLVRPADGTLS